MIVQLIDYLRARLRAVIISCYIGIGMIVVWSLTVSTHHAHTLVEKKVPFFWAIFGFFSCVAIIFFARWLGKSGIKTREDYYDK